MKGYMYNEKSKEYIGEIDLQLDKLESFKQKRDIYMKPNCCSLISPPTPTENEVVIFDNGSWVVKKDYRGYEHVITDSEDFFAGVEVINEIGIDISEKIIELPKEDLHKPQYKNGKWVEGVSQEEYDTMIDVKRKMAYGEEVDALNFKLVEVLAEAVISGKIVIEGAEAITLAQSIKDKKQAIKDKIK